MKNKFYNFHDLSFDNQTQSGLYEWFDHENKSKTINDIRPNYNRKTIPNGKNCFKIINDEKIKCRYYNDNALKISCSLLDITEDDAPFLKDGVKLCDEELYESVQEYIGFKY